jgi:hypothetical protein
LTDIDRCLAELESSAVSLSSGDAAVLREAVADVRVVVSFAREALSSETPPAERAPTRWVPIKKPSPALAVVVAAADDAIKQTPWALIEQAKSTLDDHHRHAFLLITGDALGSIFTNLFRAVWNEYPQYAPADWEH